MSLVAWHRRRPRSVVARILFFNAGLGRHPLQLVLAGEKATVTGRRIEKDGQWC